MAIVACGVVQEQWLEHAPVKGLDLVREKTKKALSACYVSGTFNLSTAVSTF